MSHRGLLGRIVVSIAILTGTFRAESGERPPVDAAALARCARIAAADQRLACYDTLAATLTSRAQPGPTSASAESGPQPQSGPGTPPGSSAADASARTSGSDSRTSATGAEASGQTTRTAADASAQTPRTAADASAQSSRSSADASGQASRAAASAFGLSQHQLHEAPQSPESIATRVAQVTADRGGNLYLLLDNGQTWFLSEPAAPLRQGDRVTIRRASLGSFLLVTPTKRSYRVRRVQ